MQHCVSLRVGRHCVHGTSSPDCAAVVCRFWSKAFLARGTSTKGFVNGTPASIYLWSGQEPSTYERMALARRGGELSASFSSRSRSLEPWRFVRHRLRFVRSACSSTDLVKEFAYRSIVLSSVLTVKAALGSSVKTDPDRVIFTKQTCGVAYTAAAHSMPNFLLMV